MTVITPELQLRDTEPVTDLRKGPEGPGLGSP